MSESVQIQKPETFAPATVAEVQDFLTLEAQLLDEWRLAEWLQLFEPGAQYLIPPLDMPEGDSRRTLYLVADDWERLQSRVKQLIGRSVWAENPQSQTCRLVSNVRVVEQTGAEVQVAANFAVWRSQFEQSDAFVGRYRHRLVRDAAGAYRFRERKTIILGDALRPQGKLGFIL